MSYTKTLFAVAILLGSISSFAQVPNWTKTTCDNNSYTMHTELAAGNAVVIEFSASWCSICNNVAPEIQQVWKDFGQGSNQVKVFGFLRDGNTFGVASTCADLSAWDTKHNITFPGFANINDVFNAYDSKYGNGGLPIVLVFIPNISNPGTSTLVYDYGAQLGTSTGDVSKDITNVLKQNGFTPLSLDDELAINTDRELVKIVDFMGRETTFKPNTPLIYIYSDGSTERRSEFTF